MFRQRRCGRVCRMNERRSRTQQDLRCEKLSRPRLNLHEIPFQFWVTETIFLPWKRCETRNGHILLSQLHCSVHPNIISQLQIHNKLSWGYNHFVLIRRQACLSLNITYPRKMLLCWPSTVQCSYNFSSNVLAECHLTLIKQCKSWADDTYQVNELQSREETDRSLWQQRGRRRRWWQEWRMPQGDQWLLWLTATVIMEEQVKDPE